MDHDLSPTLILAIPGTQETKELPREEVLEAIRRGEIAQDHWVWSPTHNDWKQVAELPELQPPPVAPTTFMNGAVPAAMSAHFPPAAQQQQAPLPAHLSAPQPKKAAAPSMTESQLLARTHYSQPMEIKHEFPIFKVLFFILFVAVAGIIAANYFMVDQPFTTNLASTRFSTVKSYAHLGAFAEPGALVIHVVPSTDLNADNFADFLTALAKSTPPEPFYDKSFDGVGITSAWQSQYVINGTDWAKFAQMDGATSDEKKKFAIEHFQQIDGSPLVIIRRNEDPAAITAAENKAWPTFVATFLAK